MNLPPLHVFRNVPDGPAPLPPPMRVAAPRKAGAKAASVPRQPAARRSPKMAARKAPPAALGLNAAAAQPKQPPPPQLAAGGVAAVVPQPKIHANINAPDHVLPKQAAVGVAAVVPQPQIHANINVADHVVPKHAPPAPSVGFAVHPHPIIVLPGAALPGAGQVPPPEIVANHAQPQQVAAAAVLPKHGHPPPPPVQPAQPEQPVPPFGAGVVLPEPDVHVQQLDPGAPAPHAIPAQAAPPPAAVQAAPPPVPGGLLAQVNQPAQAEQQPADGLIELDGLLTPPPLVLPDPGPFPPQNDPLGPHGLHEEHHVLHH